MLDADEETRLLHAAPPHLKDLIIAAIATGARLGELLRVQWKDLRVTTTPTRAVRQTLVFRAETTKTNVQRAVGQRLATVLAMRRHAPDGTPHPPEAYIFGNEVGERIQSVKTAG